MESFGTMQGNTFRYRSTKWSSQESTRCIIVVVRPTTLLITSKIIPWSDIPKCQCPLYHKGLTISGTLSPQFVNFDFVTVTSTVCFVQLREDKTLQYSRVLEL